MAGKLEKMTVQLSISPYQEMDKKQKDWCILRPALKRKLKPWEFSEKAEIDTKKWSDSELEDELKAVVRYDLKIFDVGVGDAIKAVEKGKDKEKALEDAESKISASYDKIGREIQKKLSRALEELAGGGDDSKALADGKAALKKLEDIDLELVFMDVSKNAADALRGIFAKAGTKELESKDKQTSEKAEKDIARGFIDCAKRLGDLAKQIKGSSAEVGTAMTFMKKIGKRIRDSKVATEDMNAFGKQIMDYRADFEKYIAAVDGFQQDIETLVTEVKAEKMDDARAEQLAKWIHPATEGTKAAKAVNAALKDLSQSFKRLEKQLG